MARLDTTTGACVAVGLALSWSAAGCAEDAGSRARESSSADAAVDASGDAAERAKERSVSIFVPEIVHRELIAGADGSFAYGEVTPIDGAKVCVKLRRAAFQSFAPFDELSEPICATSKAGAVVILEHVPANSDLVITIEKEGFLPASSTSRTDDRDQPVPAWIPGTVVTSLLTAGAADPWLEPATPAGPEHGLVALSAPMNWLGRIGAVAGAEQISVVMPLLLATPSEGTRLSIEEPDRSAVLEVTTRRDRPGFVSLPARTYAVRFGHPRVNCEPLVARYGWFPAGLPAAADVIEVPVLEGHVQHAAVDCFCAPPTPDQVPSDFAACTFAEPNP